MDALTALVVRTALLVRGSGASGVRRKADGSPVTAADVDAKSAILDGLSRIAPTLPAVSEEQAERRPSPAVGDGYFLVDPLDGTREFIAGRDEYTINVALMSGGVPLLGVIAAPALGLIWRGVAGHGAERLAFAADGKILSPDPIQVRARPADEVIVLVSRSHLDTRTQAFLQNMPQARAVASGSAIKFCRIAEGSADLYPRLAPTRDWDVAAGQAIVEAAGGRVAAPDEAPLRYGTAERIIPGFIASGSAG